MRNTAVRVFVAFLLLTPIFSASAAVINFDDIEMESGRDYGYVAEGYMGFNWAGGSGYYNGWVVSPRVWGWAGGNLTPPSGKNYVFSSGSDSLTLFAADGQSFDIVGFSARLGVLNGTSLISGFRDGKQVFAQNFYSTTAFQRYDFNFSNIDRLTITKNPSNILLDDLEVSLHGAASEVPEPDTALLFGLGLIAGLSACNRRRAVSGHAAVEACRPPRSCRSERSGWPANIVVRIRGVS